MPGPVGVPGDAQDDHRRVRADGLEVAEGREVSPAVARPRGDPGDRPRRHQVGHQPVGLGVPRLAGGDLGERRAWVSYQNLAALSRRPALAHTCRPVRGQLARARGSQAQQHPAAAAPPAGRGLAAGHSQPGRPGRSRRAAPAAGRSGTGRWSGALGGLAAAVGRRTEGSLSARRPDRAVGSPVAPGGSAVGSSPGRSLGRCRGSPVAVDRVGHRRSGRGRPGRGRSPGGRPGTPRGRRPRWRARRCSA
jgi:hypothetical protein